jgi:Maltokinase N-terminal cap domain
MALLHRAELTPSKLGLVSAWISSQPWFEGDPAGLVQVGAFRFDDPEGEVGIETLLVQDAGGPVFQVPLTYRGAPLEGGENALIGTMQHSVLGLRWCYDATGDPAYLATVATATLAGAHEADQFIEIDGVMTKRESTAHVVGSGDADVAVPVPDIATISRIETGTSTTVRFAEWQVEVVRSVASAVAGEASAVLTGTWAETPTPIILVSVTRA